MATLVRYRASERRLLQATLAAVEALLAAVPGHGPGGALATEREVLQA